MNDLDRLRQLAGPTIEEWSVLFNLRPDDAALFELRDALAAYGEMLLGERDEATVRWLRGAGYGPAAGALTELHGNNRALHQCSPAKPYCRCHMLADEPSEKCPIHGLAIENRCDCGRYVKARTADVDLLAALRALVDGEEGYGDMTKAMDAAKAAITKAEGRQR